VCIFVIHEAPNGLLQALYPVLLPQPPSLILHFGLPGAPALQAQLAKQMAGVLLDAAMIFFSEKQSGQIA
jgi:hypothetical protein